MIAYVNAGESERIHNATDMPCLFVMYQSYAAIYIISQVFFDMSVLFASHYPVFQQQRLFIARFEMEINETSAEVRRFLVW